jgi:hypothetical protein
MNVNKCFNIGCNFDACFAECNNMYPFACYLKRLNDKIISYDDLFSDDQHNRAYLLRLDFQNIFLDLITNFEREYDRIIAEITEIMTENSGIMPVNQQ